MKQQKRILKNNSGSTLLTVIICVSIVSILATLLISMSALGNKLKHWDKHLKQTQYYSESGLDQVYANIALQVEAALGLAYTEAKTYVDGTVFAPTDDVQVLSNTRFKLEFINAIKANTNFYATTIALINTANLTSKLDGYIADATTKYDGYSFPTVVSVDDIVVTSDPNGIDDYKYTMKDVKVEYTNSRSKLRTYIMTDIVIEAPTFDFPLLVEESALTEIPISEFAIISNQNINVNVGTTNVTGSVYAGGAGAAKINIVDDTRTYDHHNYSGITAQGGSTLNISGPAGNMVITPSWIKTNNGRIQIGNSKIICDSLVTMGTGTNSINITGNNSIIYVADDLEVNAANSYVSILGSYFGISNGALRHNSSSSIIVNGLGSTLDLSNATRVVLAGLSYFDLNPGATIANTTGDKKDSNGDYIRYYSTGESLSMIGSHVAYFMPELYSIDSVVTDGYDNFFASKGYGSISPEYYTGGSILMLNVDKTNRPDYFYDYVSGMTANNLSTVSFTGIGTGPDEITVKLNKDNSSSLLTQGALIATELKIGGTTTVNQVIAKNGSATEWNGPVATARINRFNWALRTGKWQSDADATSALQNLPTESIIERYIKAGSIVLWNEAYNKSTNGCVSFVSDRDIHISSPNVYSTLSSVPFASKGIIVTSKNVIIDSGVTFEGIIIAGGTITINSDATLIASPRAVSDTFFTNMKLKDMIFKNVTINPTTDKKYLGSTITNVTARYGDLIDFENWMKNKE